MKKFNEEIPTEEEIKNLLRTIQPRTKFIPNQRFESQTWVDFKSFLRLIGSPQRLIILFSFIVVIILAASFVSPNLNTLAQRFSRFFSLSLVNQSDMAFSILENRHPSERFTLTIAEAEAMASFKLNLQSKPPKDFYLYGATYDEIRDAIIIHYTVESGEMILRMSQQRVDSNYQGIGPDAIVEAVSINGLSGEYVAGGWMIPEVESSPEATQDLNAFQLIWNENVNLQTLRWSDSEYLYEIILAGVKDQEGYLDKDGLIDLANLLY